MSFQTDPVQGKAIARRHKKSILCNPCIADLAGSCEADRRCAAWVQHIVGEHSARKHLLRQCLN